MVEGVHPISEGFSIKEFGDNVELNEDGDIVLKIESNDALESEQMFLDSVAILCPYLVFCHVVDDSIFGLGHDDMAKELWNLRFGMYVPLGPKIISVPFPFI